jgi:hypothetical protein
MHVAGVRCAVSGDVRGPDTWMLRLWGPSVSALWLTGVSRRLPARSE